MTHKVNIGSHHRDRLGNQFLGEASIWTWSHCVTIGKKQVAASRFCFWEWPCFDWGPGTPVTIIPTHQTHTLTTHTQRKGISSGMAGYTPMYVHVYRTCVSCICVFWSSQRSTHIVTVAGKLASFIALYMQTHIHTNKHPSDLQTIHVHVYHVLPPLAHIIFINSVR